MLLARSEDMKHVLWVLVSFAFSSCSMQPRVMFWYGSEQEGVADTTWLGEAEWDGETRTRGESAQSFDITLAVVPGPMLRLEPTNNRVYWHVGGKLQDAPRTVDGSRTYLLATIRPAPRAGRLLACTVRIIGGPLTGCVVRIKPSEWVNKSDEPSYAVFELPESVHLNPGYVPFRVVDFAGK